MENKKIGIIFLIISIILGIIIFQLVSNLNNQAREIGCFNDVKCVEIESKIGISHFGFGIIGFVLALGFYLIIFSKGETELIKRLEENNKLNSKDERFQLIIKGLDPYEKKVIQIIKEQPGITQNTLRIKSDISKAKLSYVLADLEKKDLIKRIRKGKTLSVHLKV